MNIWQIQLANLNKAEAYRKRKTQRHLQDKAYFEPVYKVPKGGFGLSLNTPVDEGICFLRPSQTEYFNPKKKPREQLSLQRNTETCKAALIVDKVHNIKRLKDPERWCVFPKSETVTVEIPLTDYVHNEYKKKVVQEIGHVAWHKAYFYVDKEAYDEVLEEVEIEQVLLKVEEKSLPRWRPRTRYWNVDFIGAIEVPGTVFCTERDLIKKLKFKRGEKPTILHKRDVAKVERDTFGCSVLQRHQPPSWTYGTTPETESVDKIWNGLESRNQWVYTQLYSIWVGEEQVQDPDQQWRERVYWTGPVRHTDRDEFLCHYYPFCTDTVEDIEID